MNQGKEMPLELHNQIIKLKNKNKSYGKFSEIIGKDVQRQKLYLEIIVYIEMC